MKYIYQGHLVRKRFGQHFLNDQRIVESVVSAINPKKSQIMLEIGPGLAALTEPVSRLLDTLIVIELDRDLVKRLRIHPFLKSKLIIYQQDAKTVNFKMLSEKFSKPLRIFGNLPYNISTSLIFHLFKYIDVITDMHFMLQKEVANRLVAKPGNKIYGRMSIITQYFCQVSVILEVPSTAYIPQSNVDSVLIRLIPYTKVPYPVKDLNILNFITMEAFKQRRKMIRNSLKNLFTVEELKAFNINPDSRAENVSTTQYFRMANYFNDNKQ